MILKIVRAHTNAQHNGWELLTVVFVGRLGAVPVDEYAVAAAVVRIWLRGGHCEGQPDMENGLFSHMFLNIGLFSHILLQRVAKVTIVNGVCRLTVTRHVFHGSAIRSLPHRRGLLLLPPTFALAIIRRLVTLSPMLSESVTRRGNVCFVSTVFFLFYIIGV